MSNKVYVGNLPYSFTNEDLNNLCAAFGVVRRADVMIDRETNRSRGFGFVEMETVEAVRDVIGNLHDTELQGRRLVVNEARERVPGGPGGPRAFAGPRPGGGGRPGDGMHDAPRSSGGHEYGAARASGAETARGWRDAPHAGGGYPREGGGASRGGGGAARGGGGAARGGSGAMRGSGGATRGGGRPRRDEGDRWSDGGGRRRRQRDDFGDE
jgi:hypothetical protein